MKFSHILSLALAGSVAAVTTLTASTVYTFGGYKYQATEVSPFGTPAGQRTYRIQNVRFGADTSGANRWKIPQPIVGSDLVNVQHDTTDRSCSQIGGANSTHMTVNLSNLFSNWSSIAGVAITGQEDCLFLDVFIPEEAFTVTAPVPVVNYIYGGAWISGSKDIYKGLPFIQSARDRGEVLIWVVGNYRLGPLGFMAGPLVTATPGAVANAGLYDQRATLQWIQDNIGQLNGSPTNVTAWGESGGGASIMLHLIAEGGTKNPNFVKAIVMSPGMVPQWVPAASGGYVKNYTYSFADLNGCSNPTDLTCLRSKTLNTLGVNANTLANAQPGGLPIWGPVVDGTWIKDLPALEVSAGHIHSLQAIAVSHTRLEGDVFVPLQASTNTPTNWKAVVSSVFPTELGDAIGTDLIASGLAEYPFKWAGSTVGTYPDEKTSLAQTIGDLIFMCNGRALIDHYKAASIPVYVASTDFWFGYHATDILNLVLAGEDITQAAKFRRSLAAFATTTDPNHARGVGPSSFINAADLGGVSWPEVTEGNTLSNVLTVQDFTWALTVDGLAATTNCSFWQTWQQAALVAAPI